ncbi:MAG: hypothetical protein LDL30_05740 [Desulfovibrio sp.]|nr:hypothetical protein [Desulfovibrio sp.]
MQQALCILLGAVICSGLWSAFPNNGYAENMDLMQQHAHRKRLARDIILENLRSKGLLPANGVVEFSARSVPDPHDPTRLQIQIDSLRIQPLPEYATQLAPQGEQVNSWSTIIPGGVLQPTTFVRSIEYMELDIPVQQVPEVRWQHSFRIRAGEVEDAPDLTQSRPSETTSGTSPKAVEGAAPAPPAVTLDIPIAQAPHQEVPAKTDNATQEPWYKQLQ